MGHGASVGGGERVLGSAIRAALRTATAAALAAALAMVLWPGPAFAATYRWNADADGDWTDPGNWTLQSGPPNPLGYPNAIDDVAELTDAITANRTITITDGVTITLAGLVVDDDNDYTITTGFGQLVFDTTADDLQGTNATLTVGNSHGNGAHIIAVPVKLQQSLDVTITSTGTLTFTRQITEQLIAFFKRLSISGGGTVRLAPDVSNFYQGVTQVLAGTLEMAGTGGAQAVTGDLTIGGGGQAATVLLLADNQIFNNTLVTVTSDGVLDMNGHTDGFELTVTGGTVTIGTGTLGTAGPLQMTGGSITSTGAGQLSLGGNVVANPSPVAATITGTVNLNSGAMISAVAGPAEPDLIIDGRIIGGIFTKAGSGTVRLTGPGDNTMTQAVALDGLLELAKPSGVSISGPFRIGNGLVLDDEATVSVLTSEQIADTSSVEVRVDGDLLFNGSSITETIAGLTITGSTVSQIQVVLGSAHLIVGMLSLSGTTITMGTTGQLTLTNGLTVPNTWTGTAITGGSLNLGAGGTRIFDIGNNAANIELDINAVITGSATLAKTGAGVMRTAGAGTFNGPTTIAAGVLFVNSTHPSPVSLTGGRLGGAGTIGSLTGTNGMVSPGDPNTLATTTGHLRTGSVSLSPTVTYFVEKNGTIPGLYDQLAVTGTVTLNDASLVVDSPGVVQAVARLTIIDNDGTDPIVGTFAGLAEGAQVPALGPTLRITYIGGDGNDVVVFTDGPPTLNQLTDLTIAEDAALQTVNLTIGDDVTAPEDLIVTAQSTNQTLVANAGLTLGGTGTARTLQFAPAANASGTSTITVRVTDEFAFFVEHTFLLTVYAVNDAPTITAIGPQTIAEDGSLAPVAFTVDDVDDVVADVTVTGSSSNQLVVTNASVMIGGTGASRTVALTPVANANGVATITVQASDGEATTQQTFLLTVDAVNDAPQISPIGPLTIPEGNTVSPAFVVSDIDGALANITVTASSSNQSVVTTESLVILGAVPFLSVSVAPVAHAHGTTTITLHASDGEATGQQTFVLTVTNVNDAPTITTIGPQTINEDTSLAPVTFTVADVDDDVSALTVTATSSNQALVPNANLTLAATPRSIAATPLANAFGTTTITVTVSDGKAQASTAFVLTVNDVAEPTDPPPPAITYLLAEGATGGFFDTDLLIANPNLTNAPITVTFLKQDGTTVVVTRQVAAQRHVTIHVDELPGLEETSAATTIRSDAGLPLAVERTMFWDASRYGGHTDAAVPGPSTSWVFGEGAQGFFDTYLLIANANTTAAELTVTFLREGAPPLVTTRSVGALSRLTIYAGDFPELLGGSFGISVNASLPVSAERATYFGTTPSRLWSGGQASAGVAQPSRSWFLAEGATGPFFDTFILLGNAGAVAATVNVQFLLDTGEVIVATRTVPAQGRVTIPVDLEPDPRVQAAAFSTVVTSDVPIVAERSMYWPTGEAQPWGEAHHAVGLTGTSTRWALAEGRVGGAFGYITYVLLANPSSTAADVTVRYLRENGAPIVRTYTVPPTSRVTVDVGATVTELQNELFGAAITVTNGVGIAVERAMYWSANGIFFAGGTGAAGTRLP